jgi:septal ring factor EnvC (AmiA/AmiB activator)
MDEHTFAARFTELLNKIKQLPETQRAQLEQIANQTKERRAQIQGSLAELQESLDYLRLSVKYLVFDLEATRRENAYLRRLIEKSDRQDRGPREPRQGDNFLDDTGPNK